MNRTDVFDVLVVYSGNAAQSAGNAAYAENTPFSEQGKHANYHSSYAYLLEMCATKTLSAAFTTSSDIVGDGTCSSYWVWKNNLWHRVLRRCYSELIFDKFFPKTRSQRARRKLLFSSKKTRSFSNPKLFGIFYDKLQTHDELPIYSIPTVSVDSKSPDDITSSLLKLKGMMANSLDSAYSDSFVLKDRFGTGGTNIYKIGDNNHHTMGKIMSMNRSTEFVLQPYIDFDEGYSHEESRGNTEIRLIFLGQKIVQSYIRSAKEDGFICNQGEGGVKIELQGIPLGVKKAGIAIAKKLNKKYALFALDFIVGNNGKIYLLEGNISPGINWNEAYPENVKMNKEMIDIIVDELSRRVNLS